MEVVNVEFNSFYKRTFRKCNTPTASYNGGQQHLNNNRCEQFIAFFTSTNWLSPHNSMDG